MLGGMSIFLRDAQAQQMAPSGFSGAINTPTADVLPWGSVKLGYSNSIPERATRYPGEPFGGLTAGFGALPGLELVGRLAFDGDLNCNMFQIGCRGRTRDLSLSGKYQFPLNLPLNTKLAVGFTDYGGAATNFRSAYGVATSAVGPLDLSIGFGKKGSATALLGGVFGSAVLHVTDQLQVIAESDTRAKRVGAAFTQPITDQLALQFGWSRKLNGPASQQTNQMTASMQYMFDKSMLPKRGGIGQSSSKPSAGPLVDRSAENDKLTPAAQAQAMADTLKKSGFSQVSVRYAPAAGERAAHWQLIVEPLLKRHSQALAIGNALGIWLNHVGSAQADLTLALTYMGQAYRRVSTTKQCLTQFVSGNSQCAQGTSLIFDQSDSSLAQPSFQTLVNNESELAYKPQFELGPDLVTSVGTEVGLFDYSLALDTGLQMQLARGLFLHGNVLLPVARSDDFRENGVFRGRGQSSVRVDQALISYIKPVTLAGLNLQTQLTAGSMNRLSRGAQAEALWFDSSGKWTVGGTLGAYTRRGVTSTPALLSVKRSIVPGRWSMEATAGEFLRGDRGWSLKSEHWFADVNLSFVAHSSAGGPLGPVRRSFAGFEISVPFTALGQKDVGWASFRGVDRLKWGVKTKVGDVDNAVTIGYAELPKPRHGLSSDLSDHGRAARADAWAGRQAIREAMASVQESNK
jgi:hypothetical protein